MSLLTSPLELGPPSMVDGLTNPNNIVTILAIFNLIFSSLFLLFLSGHCPCTILQILSNQKFFISILCFLSFPLSLILDHSKELHHYSSHHRLIPQTPLLSFSFRCFSKSYFIISIFLSLVLINEKLCQNKKVFPQFFSPFFSPWYHILNICSETMNLHIDLFLFLKVIQSLLKKIILNLQISPELIKLFPWPPLCLMLRSPGKPWSTLCC